MTGDRTALADPGGGAAQRVAAHVRPVLEVVRKPNGVSELHLECGHTVRRRIAFCPPTRLACERCRSEAIATKTVAIA